MVISEFLCVRARYCLGALWVVPMDKMAAEDALQKSECAYDFAYMSREIRVSYTGDFELEVLP